jgi:hypothetical protein
VKEHLAGCWPIGKLQRGFQHDFRRRLLRANGLGFAMKNEIRAQRGPGSQVRPAPGRITTFIAGRHQPRRLLADTRPR